MLLTITYTRQPATDLGYLLHKNPQRPQSFELAFGKAHVFYPEVSEGRCTAALLLDIAPVALVRGGKDSKSEGLFNYINDRPYVASSFMSTAISRVFGAAMAGRSKERPGLVDEAVHLQVGITMLPCRGGEDIIYRIFEPLGYEVDVKGYILDETFPEWGQSPYYDVNLNITCRLQDLLNQLYVLIPVLDRDKHYWIGKDEVEKLLKHGEGWLADHPDIEMITSRYLKRQRNLINQALSRLLEEDTADPEEEMQKLDAEEEDTDRSLNLNQQRLGTVLSVLKSSGAKRVIDLGCGEGNLVSMLFKDKTFTAVAGMDVSPRSLERARKRLRFDQLNDRQKERLDLFLGSLTYKDKRLEGYDAATVTEVIEHLDTNRLAAFGRVVFEFARPGTVIVTTPNQEYNVRYPNLLKGVRHKDHRFEWNRKEFQDWAERTAQKYKYTVSFLSVGEEDPELGAPTQMGVFKL